MRQAISAFLSLFRTQGTFFWITSEFDRTVHRVATEKSAGTWNDQTHYRPTW